MQAVNANSLCRFCPLLPSLSSVSRGDRDRVGDLGLGSDSGQGDRADQRVVRRVSGQGRCTASVSGPTFCVGVECGVRLECCPFDVEIIAKMREAAVVLEGQAAPKGPRRS